MQVMQRIPFKKSFFQEVWAKYMENWQFPATAQKDLSPPHLDMQLDFSPVYNRLPTAIKKKGFCYSTIFR